LDYWDPGDGTDTIDGGADYDTLIITGTPVLYDDYGKGYGGSSFLKVVVADGAITSIAGGTVANVESVMLDLGDGYDTLDYAGTMEAVTVNLATSTATGFTSIAGVESILGGFGNDALTGDAGPNSLAGGAGLDTLTGGDGFDNLHGGDGADSLDGGAGGDRLEGDYGDDVLDGGAGDDQLKGGIGFDTLTGGTGIDRFEGDLSELNGDRITDYEADEKIFLEGSLSGAGNVRLVAIGADTELQIDGDNDGSFETVMTLNGTISGTIILSNEALSTNAIRIVSSSAVPTSGSDLLVGTPAADTIDGLAGDDEIFGLAGNDTLIGGTGTDTLYGSDGNDDLSGGAERDILHGDSGADMLEGGGGYDALYGGDGDDVLTDSGTDSDSGSSAFMDGGAGNDILLDSSAGRAVLYGGAGNDILIGGIGEDYLYGGDGNDTFVLGSTADSIEGARDQIRDWETSDIIDLADIDANTSIGGNQDFTFLGLGAADLTVGQSQLKYFQSFGTTYLVGNATADNQADFVIQINGLHDLTAAQILGLATDALGNTAPVATADSYSINEDEALNIAAAGVLLNDTDADNEPLTALLVSGAQHGTLALNADGSFSYTPDANYNGLDSFTYKANDGEADSNVATVSLTVTPVNDAPVAVDDSYITNEDTTLTVAAASVLANDSDVDSAALTASLVSGPAHGTVTLNADGSFSYTPDANYNGPDSFTYKAFDGSANSDVPTVSFTIGSGGNFDTITAALASGLVHPGDTLALLPGYNTENATVGIENLTFSGDASNTGIALTFWGIMAITLTGTAPIAVTGNGSVNGNDGSNVLAGCGGNDSINGGAGDDTLTGGHGNDSINGGAGDDTIYYEVGDGTPAPSGAFNAWQYEPAWYWQPGDGIDTIDGGPDHDTLNISGTPQYIDDEGKGHGGNSWLNVVVEDGAITSIGGATVANVESVMLDLGDQQYWGPDEDILDYAGTTEGVTVNLATGTATGGFTSIAGVEYVSGGSGNDALTGDAGHDMLKGVAGLDTLTGGDGPDALYGGDGADSLNGGAGDDYLVGGDLWGTGSLGDGDQDILTGGLGADSFGFRFAADSVVVAPDVITDWESSDKLSFGEFDANTSVDGYQHFTFLGLGAADLTVGQGQLKYYQSDGNTYVVGNVTADNQADFQIQISGVHTLAIDDFIL
jgi:VCBS repeat-containing protein